MDFHMERKPTEDHSDEVIVFRGEVRGSDLTRLRLTRLDRALLDNVGGDNKATPADHLLALEMIFRRHQEQTPNVEETPNASLTDADLADCGLLSELDLPPTADVTGLAPEGDKS